MLHTIKYAIFIIAMLFSCLLTVTILCHCYGMSYIMECMKVIIIMLFHVVHLDTSHSDVTSMTSIMIGIPQLPDILTGALPKANFERIRLIFRSYSLSLTHQKVENLKWIGTEKNGGGCTACPRSSP